MVGRAHARARACASLTKRAVYIVYIYSAIDNIRTDIYNRARQSRRRVIDLQIKMQM